ncbi:MAG: hypothetical protein WCJ84_00955 [Candidatus Peregrinibacteria bacterium]
MKIFALFLQSAGMFILSFGVLTIFSVSGNPEAFSDSHAVSPVVIQKSLLRASAISSENTAPSPLPTPQKITIAPPQAPKCFPKTTFPTEYPQVQKTIERVSRAIPCTLLTSLQTVSVFQDDEKRFPRALSGASLLKIREDAIADPRFSDVILHEMGHIVDLGGLVGDAESGESAFKDGSQAIYKNDISLLFYSISWTNEKTRKSEVTDFDFVGGYAASDPFEDFAESFLYYIRHGNEFRLLSAKNTLIQEKYNFFKNFVFEGKEFESGKTDVNTAERPWDITKY